MNHIFINWKTSAAGGALILGALADVLTQFASKTPDGNRLLADVTAFITGVGLIFAKDASS
jgi:hypothetical protein